MVVIVAEQELNAKSKKTDIKSLTEEELEKILVESGEKKYRASQIYRWMHVELAACFDDMTNLPKSLRQKLEDNFEYTRLRCVDRQISKVDGTQKFLFALPDDNLVESVFMKYRFGNSICISSQVGCRMGCRFCASTLGGLERNLAPSEMLEQIYEIRRHTGEKISHVVVMGTGEPLDNYDNVVKFLRLLSGEGGMNLSQRSITLSTCGIVPCIYDLADEKFAINLALSLHAVTDAKRREIMPIAEKYSISEIMKAMKYYFDTTGRQVTFEYTLIRGVNDSIDDAEGLSSLARPLGALVNLIPVNPVKERGFVQTDAPAVASFKNKLENSGINVTIRREMGRDIDGACGQLRRRHLVKS